MKIYLTGPMTGIERLRLKLNNICIDKARGVVSTNVHQHVTNLARRAQKKVSALILLVLNHINLQSHHTFFVFTLVCHLDLLIMFGES